LSDGTRLGILTYRPNHREIPKDSMADQQHNAYLPGYDQVKHHEWRTVENSAAYILPELQNRVAANPGLKLLDVGAGSGTITVSIAKYMPEGHITACDLSEDIVSRASKHAEEVGVTNVTFREASVYELLQTFGENVFDAVHAHQMLCHLDSPVQALAEMLKVVKPGGVVAMREIDMRMWSIYPNTATMKAWLRVQLGVHAASGGSNEAGPSLIAWAMKAGAKRENIRAGMGTWMYSTPGERQVWGKSPLPHSRLLSEHSSPGFSAARWVWKCNNIRIAAWSAPVNATLRIAGAPSCGEVIRRLLQTRKANMNYPGTSFRDRITNGEMRKKALELQLASEAELDEMGEEWQRWIDTEDACCGTMHGEILIMK